MTIFAGKRPTGDLITDGLIMALDMGNGFSYRPSAYGNRIKDMSGITYTYFGQPSGSDAIMSSSALSYISDKGGAIAMTNQIHSATGQFPVITTGNTFTLGIWIYPTATGNSTPIFQLSAQGRGSGLFSTYAATTGLQYQGSTGSAQVAATVKTSSTTLAATSTTAWVLNTYQYYAMTFDGTNLILYKNGSSVGTNTTGGTYASGSVGTDYVLGVAAGAAGINAQYYMAHIYNRALSAAEVTSNYDATRARFGL
jgi:hypothetical protein